MQAYQVLTSRTYSYDGPDLKLLGLELRVCCLVHHGSTGYFVLLQILIDVVWHPGLSIAVQLIVFASPPFGFILDVIMIYWFVVDDSLTS